jgi:hypothetical protein
MRVSSSRNAALVCDSAPAWRELKWRGPWNAGANARHAPSRAPASNIHNSDSPQGLAMRSRINEETRSPCVIFRARGCIQECRDSDSAAHGLWTSSRWGPNAFHPPAHGADRPLPPTAAAASEVHCRAPLRPSRLRVVSVGPFRPRPGLCAMTPSRSALMHPSANCSRSGVGPGPNTSIQRVALSVRLGFATRIQAVQLPSP